MSNFTKSATKELNYDFATGEHFLFFKQRKLNLLDFRAACTYRDGLAPQDCHLVMEANQLFALGVRGFHHSGVAVKISDDLTSYHIELY